MFEMIFLKNFLVLSSVVGLVFSDSEYDSRISFPGALNYGHSRDPQSQTMSLEMEIQLAREYSQIENIQDVITRINGLPDDFEMLESSIASRLGSDERSNAEIPKAATCIPELQPVSLKNSSIATSAFYIPSCTRVPRCGGCCGHQSLSCQPTATVVRNFQVIVTEFDVINRITYKRKEIVPIEEHTKCACNCKTKEHHCNDKQNYLPKECRCACANIDDESKCLDSNATKDWDENLCICRCRGSTECTTGSYYDHNICSCRQIGAAGGHRRQIGQEQRPYSLPGRVVPPVYAIRADDPRRRHREDPKE